MNILVHLKILVHLPQPMSSKNFDSAIKKALKTLEIRNLSDPDRARVLVVDKKFPLRAVARVMGIPRSKVKYWVDHPDCGQKRGPRPFLDEESNEKLKDYVRRKADAHEPVTLEDICTEV